jgi:dihydrolipoamide dehydrogenase
MDTIETDIVVIGAGPGGYAAAFYAADKGRKVILVEQDKRLGGVCLNRGCIPSKALLHATKLITEARESAKRGITFAPPQIDLARLRAWKESILEKLGGGVKMLAQKRGVQLLQGRAAFENSTLLRVETDTGPRLVRFAKAIVATGSRSVLPRAFDIGDPRVMTSRGALQLDDIPNDLLIIGGGYIGMELGTVYAALGSRVVVIEALPTILSGADADLVRPVALFARKAFKEIRVGAKVLSLTSTGAQIKVESESEGQRREELFDRVLVSVGRAPNSENLGLEKTAVTRDARGFITINDQQQTTDPAIYAIGDVAGGLMLAHKAAREARVAVEVITGEPSRFAEVVPAVVFTDPEIAWCGLTEADAKAKNILVEVAKFPWGASGRALTHDRVDGLTKLILEPATGKILGVGIVGAGAGELISDRQRSRPLHPPASDALRNPDGSRRSILRPPDPHLRPQAHATASRVSFFAVQKIRGEEFKPRMKH